MNREYLFAGFGGQGLLFSGKVLAYKGLIEDKNVRNAKKAIKKAFQNQIDGKGFSLVEVVSSCPTNWGMTPKQALDWIESDMLPYYPLGVYKDRSAEQKEAE